MTTATPGEDIGATPSPRSRERERISWQRYSQTFRIENPDLFDPFDKVAIRDAMLDEGLPRSVMEDLLDHMLGIERKHHDPHYKSEKRTPPPRPTPEQREAAQAERQRIVTETQQRTLAVIGPDFVMSDGRALGDWTIGELRKLAGVFAVILAKAGKRDDSRRVRDVMQVADWKKAAGPA